MLNLKDFELWTPTIGNWGLDSKRSITSMKYCCYFPLILSFRFSKYFREKKGFPNSGTRGAISVFPSQTTQVGVILIVWSGITDSVWLNSLKPFTQYCCYEMSFTNPWPHHINLAPYNYAKLTKKPGKISRALKPSKTHIKRGIWNRFVSFINVISQILVELLDLIHFFK